jgi:hypothetical protein
MAYRDPTSRLNGWRPHNKTETGWTDDDGFTPGDMDTPQPHQEAEDAEGLLSGMTVLPNGPVGR